MAGTVLGIEQCMQQNHPGILLVGNFLSAYNGSRGVCEDLAARLQKDGWSVVTTSRQPRRAARLADMLATVWRQRMEYQIAQVEVFSGPAFLWAEAVCWALRRADKPYILALHGGNLPAFARRWPGRVRRLLQSAAVVTAPSRYLSEQMKPYRGDIHLLPNPLDIGQYHFRLRKQPRPQLVWLRAFHSIYNPALAPRVLTCLKETFPDARLIMVGPDKGDSSFQTTQAVARELGVYDCIEFPGGVPKAEVPRWLQQGDIFINTTYVDNTPVSVLEAMACGLCVASTNVGGIPYLLEDNEDALLVPPGDPQAMANAILRLLTEPGLAEHLSRKARRKAEQFDWSVILPQWKTLLDELYAEGIS